MKKLITILTVIMLTGCGFYVTPEQLEHALSQCANNGGVAKIHLEIKQTKPAREVICNDGAKFHWSKFKENNND